MKTKWKLPVILGCIVSMMLSGCSSVSRETDKSETSTETENTASAKKLSAPVPGKQPRRHLMEHIRSL